MMNETLVVRRDIFEASLAPRGLCRVQAARYIGVSPGLFVEMVADGRMPKPRRINTRVVWDRIQLDAAFDLLPCESDNDPNPWDGDG